MPITSFPKSILDLPHVIPLFPLRDTLVLPRGDLPLHVFEPRYLALVDDVLKTNRLIGIIQPEDHEDTENPHPTLASVGCMGRVTAFQEVGNGQYQITVTGICRFRILREENTQTPYRQVSVNWSDYEQDLVQGAGEDDVDRDQVIATLKAFLKANDMDADWAGIRKAPNEPLVNALSMMAPYGMKEKQALLEAPDLKTRAEILVAITEMNLTRNSNTDTTLQ